MSEPLIRGNQNTTKLINQFKRSSVQYPCLDKAQERAMIEKYKDDREKLNHLLFMHNIRLVFSMAKRYMSRTDDYDSLVQNGMHGLAEAAKRFKIEKNIKFSTCATIWIKKYMTMYYYSAQYKNIDSKTVSMNSPSLASDKSQSDVSPDDTFENCVYKYADPSLCQDKYTMESQVSADEQRGICQELYRRMQCDSSLSAMDKAVFEKLFINQEKPRDIAFEYNIKQSAVSEIRNRILCKFRDILRNDYKVNSYDDIS